MARIRTRVRHLDWTRNLLDSDSSPAQYDLDSDSAQDMQDSDSTRENVDSLQLCKNRTAAEKKVPSNG